MNWQGYAGRLGEWSWYYELPNGWTAAVHDDSQMIAPKQPTRYQISAICAHWIRQGKQDYATLEEAKGEAMRLAMVQDDVCSGPGSEYHFAALERRERK